MTTKHAREQYWHFVVAFPRGHRVYQAPDGRYAIADDSGEYPDTTDDGTCWIDPARPVVIHCPRRRDEPRFFIPIICDGKPTQAVAEHREGMWVASVMDTDRYGVPVGMVYGDVHSRFREDYPEYTTHIVEPQQRDK